MLLTTMYTLDDVLYQNKILKSIMLHLPPWPNHAQTLQKPMTSEKQKHQKYIPFHYTGWFLGIPLEFRMDHSKSY